MFSLSHPVTRARRSARAPVSHRTRARVHVGRATRLRGAGGQHRKSVSGNDARSALHLVRRQRLLLARPGRKLRGRRTPLEHRGTRDGGARQRDLQRDRQARDGSRWQLAQGGSTRRRTCASNRTTAPSGSSCGRPHPVGDGLREPHLQRPPRPAGCGGLEEHHRSAAAGNSPRRCTRAPRSSRAVSGGSAQLALGFASTKGIVRIDDVYLDPRMRR